MKGAVGLVWVLLSVASIMAWASFLKGLWLRFVDRPRIEKSLKATAMADGRTRDFLRYASVDDAEPEELSARFVGQLDAGVQYLVGFVVPWAPQLGLLGTALGLSAAMAGLAGAEEFDPAAALPGISTSLQTTVAGLIVAGIGLAANRLLIVPSLAAIDESAVTAVRAMRREIAKRTKHLKAEQTPSPPDRFVFIPYVIDSERPPKPEPNRVADVGEEAKDRAKYRSG